MRNYILLLAGFLMQFVNAQIGFGTNNIRGANLIDFGINKVNGIVLPYNQNTPKAVGGTLRVELNSSKIQYFNDTDWIDLTEEGLINTQVNNGIENNLEQGVVISDKDSQSPGVLVLESDNKAMVLPHVENPHLTIINPPTGMICYDIVSKTIAIFNGMKWFFYK